MKRFLLFGLLAAAAGILFEASASAWPLRLERYGGCNRTGRIKGYWMHPSAGPLYDYSSYFAAVYPYLPGSQEYQWQPPYGANGYAQFGTSVAVLPAAPPANAVNRQAPALNNGAASPQGTVTSSPR